MLRGQERKRAAWNEKLEILSLVLTTQLAYLVSCWLHLEPTAGLKNGRGRPECYHLTCHQPGFLLGDTPPAWVFDLQASISPLLAADTDVLARHMPSSTRKNFFACVFNFAQCVRVSESVPVSQQAASSEALLESPLLFLHHYSGLKFCLVKILMKGKGKAGPQRELYQSCHFLMELGPSSQKDIQCVHPSVTYSRELPCVHHGSRQWVSCQFGTQPSYLHIYTSCSPHLGQNHEGLHKYTFRWHKK